MKQYSEYDSSVYYDDFMAYVDSLDVLKQYLVDNIKSADVSAVKEGADIINEVNKDLMNVLDLLKSQKYDQAGAAIGKISFDKVEAFIEAQIPSN